MDIQLKKKPKNPIIVEGFPGFGLVGTIATEFLLDHLVTEQIGSIWIPELPAIAAIHRNKVISPLGIHYSKKYNIVFIHGVTAVTGIEWQLAEAIVQMAKQLGAKEIISLEGIGSAVKSQTHDAFYYASKSVSGKKLDKYCKGLKEGIIMGVTGALLVRRNNVPITAIFAETSSNLPDSKAAAKVIEVLDNYLGLKVNFKPLLKQAEKFEDKLKTLLQKSKQTVKQGEKKTLSYVG
ncbi:MAG: PAC2 family protein [Nanoarchaeota archaeon]|nr:PAC2 family protein [Nanoarchaeota archaeon]